VAAPVAAVALALVLVLVLVLVLMLHHRSARRGFVFALSFREEVEVAFAFSLFHLMLQQHGCALLCQG